MLVGVAAGIHMRGAANATVVKGRNTTDGRCGEGNKSGAARLPAGWLTDRSAVMASADRSQSGSHPAFEFAAVGCQCATALVVYSGILTALVNRRTKIYRIRWNSHGAGCLRSRMTDKCLASISGNDRQCGLRIFHQLARARTPVVMNSITRPGFARELSSEVMLPRRLLWCRCHVECSKQHRFSLMVLSAVYRNNSGGYEKKLLNLSNHKLWII